MPLPSITAPMYLKGRPAAIVKTAPYAVPENAPKIINNKNTIQKLKLFYWGNLAAKGNATIIMLQPPKPTTSL